MTGQCGPVALGPARLRVAVPPMMSRRGGRIRTGLYRIDLSPDVSLLIAETRTGYVGVPLRCPHADLSFARAGEVRFDDVPGETATLYCNGHGVHFSLDSGEAVSRQLPAGERPSRLGHLYRVERVGDEFLIWA